MKKRFNAVSVHEPRLVEDARAVLRGSYADTVAFFLGYDGLLKENPVTDAENADHAVASVRDIALQKNIASEAVLTALVVAQAAERTAVLAATAETLAEKTSTLTPGIVQEKHVQDAATVMLRKMDSTYVELNDPRFRHVGRQSDPDIIKQAQARWAAAQMYFNTEYMALQQTAYYPSGNYPSIETAGPQYADGLRADAACFYTEAAGLMSGAGQHDLADLFKTIARAITGTIKNPAAPSSSKLVENMAATEERIVKAANDDLERDFPVRPQGMESSPRFGFDADTVKKLLKMF